MAEKAKEAFSKLPKMPKIPGGGLLGPIAKLAFGAGAVGGTLYYSLFNVTVGHRAILFNRWTGVSDKVVEEGTHFCIPWLEWPIYYDVRTRPYEVAAETGTRDLQQVSMKVRVLHKPDQLRLSTMYRNLGTDYAQRVFPSIINEVCKQVVAQFNASQLLTQREQVSRLIRRNLMDRSTDFNIVLEDVSLVDIRFGSEFTKAVENKQVAQQEAERAVFLVDKALQDKRSAVIKAEGNAKSAEMVGRAIRHNPGYLELQRIDTAREISQTMSRSANKVYLDADALMLNLLTTSGIQSRLDANNKRT